MRLIDGACSSGAVAAVDAPWIAPPPVLAQLPLVLRGLARLDWSKDPFLQRTLASFFRAHFETVCLPHVRRPSDEQSLKALVDGLVAAGPTDDASYAPCIVDRARASLAAPSS